MKILQTFLLEELPNTIRKGEFHIESQRVLIQTSDQSELLLEEVTEKELVELLNKYGPKLTQNMEGFVFGSTKTYQDSRIKELREGITPNEMTPERLLTLIEQLIDPDTVECLDQLRKALPHVTT